MKKVKNETSKYETCWNYGIKLFIFLQFLLAIATAICIDFSKKDGSYEVRESELIIVVINACVSALLKVYLIVCIGFFWHLLRTPNNGNETDEDETDEDEY